MTLYKGDYAMITIISVMVVAIGIGIFDDWNLPTTHTASTTTDYFSWSCQQLKAQINDDLNTSNHLLMNSGSTREGTEAVALLLLMQLKGCSA